MGPSIKLKKEPVGTGEEGRRSGRVQFAAGVRLARGREGVLAKLEDADSDEEILNKLKGLGYID